MRHLLHHLRQERIMPLKPKTQLIKIIKHIIRQHMLQNRRLAPHSRNHILANRRQELNIDVLAVLLYQRLHVPRRVRRPRLLDKRMLVPVHLVKNIVHEIAQRCMVLLPVGPVLVAEFGFPFAQVVERQALAD